MNEPVEKKFWHQVARLSLGEKVAVLCARYQYRGILAEVGEDYLNIAQAVAVEVSGRSMSRQATTEDVIGSTVTIMSAAIEIIYKPQWAEAPLPGENPSS